MSGGSLTNRQVVDTPKRQPSGDDRRWTVCAVGVCQLDGVCTVAVMGQAGISVRLRADVQVQAIVMQSASSGPSVGLRVDAPARERSWSSSRESVPLQGQDRSRRHLVRADVRLPQSPFACQVEPGWFRRGLQPTRKALRLGCWASILARDAGGRPTAIRPTHDLPLRGKKQFRS